jgi:hypothetical protein
VTLKAHFQKSLIIEKYFSLLMFPLKVRKLKADKKKYIFGEEFELENIHSWPALLITIACLAPAGI